MRPLKTGTALSVRAIVGAGRGRPVVESHEVAVARGCSDASIAFIGLANCPDYKLGARFSDPGVRASGAALGG